MTAHWQDLGIELNIDDHTLEKIRIDSPENVERSTTEMFRKWHRRRSNEVTWKNLIDALESPSLEMNELAGEIRQKLSSGS